MNDKELLDKLDEVAAQGELPGIGFEKGWRGWMLNDNSFLGLMSEQTAHYPTVREAIEALLAGEVE